MDTSQSIGQRIKLVRGELSQKAFGDRIGISQTTVTALENDQSKPRLNTLAKIAEGFRVNFEWLRTGIGSMRGEPLPVAPQHFEEATISPNSSLMSAHTPLSEMSAEDQLAYWRVRAEIAEGKLAAIEEAARHETAVRLVGSSGGRSFTSASADAADDDYTPPQMTAETIAHNAEAPAEAEPIRIRRWGSLGR